MKIWFYHALVILGVDGLLLGGCVTTRSASEIPPSSDVLAGHWLAKTYVYTLDLRLNRDGSFRMTVLTFDIDDDELKGSWSLAPGDRLVLTFRASKRHPALAIAQHVGIVEDLTATSFSLRRIETFFNPLEFIREKTP